MAKRKLRYRAVFISDVHLGSRGCRAKDLAALLKRVKCDQLYLVGDIVDMWRLRQRWYWPAKHNEVVRQVLKIAKKGTRVLLIPGNHDAGARQYKGLNFGGVEIVLEAQHETADGKRLLITHGDQFDMVVKHAKLLSMAGGWAYDWLVVLNTGYNFLRQRLGMSYWSLSQYIKLKVKSACTFIGAFEQALIDQAKRDGLDGVVCGHIHKAEIRRGDIDYFNCGDWVESCTLLVEHHNGEMELIDGLATLDTLRQEKRQAKLAARQQLEALAQSDDADDPQHDSSADQADRDWPADHPQPARV